MRTTQIALRLPTELLARIDQLVPAVHSSRSEVIRCALKSYLSRIEAERDAAVYDQMPLTADELSLADDPEGWALTPKW